MLVLLALLEAQPMIYGRHRRPVYLVPFLTSAAAVLVIVAVFWASSRTQPEDASERERRANDRQTTTAATDRVRVELAAAGCRAARDRVAGMQAVTSTAMQQWRLHIDAMNQLLAGKITLAQATAFWESTRVEGQRTMTSWRQVDSAFRERPPSCAPVPDVQSEQSDAITQCADRIESADIVFGRARTTLADWQMHIEHMEALRAGTLSPSRALRAWKKVYQRAGPQISAYDQAYEELTATPGCGRV